MATIYRVVFPVAEQQQMKWLRSDLDGPGDASLASVRPVWPQDCGLLPVGILKMNKPSRASTSLCLIMYIIYSFITACHAHINNSYLLCFHIFHISWFGVISLFPPTPVQFGFVVFVWIFNGCKWKVHGFSTLNVVIHMIGERREWQNSISSDLFCFCLEQCSVQN